MADMPIEIPPHRLETREVKYYMESDSPSERISATDIVRVLTPDALHRMMMGYEGYNDLTKQGQEEMQSEKLINGVTLATLPMFVYGIVSESVTDTTQKEIDYLDYYEIDFFAEDLLDGFGTECSSYVTMWEYDVSFVKRQRDDDISDIHRYPKFQERFHFHPVAKCWVKKKCAICNSIACPRITAFDELVSLYSSVRSLKNISDRSRRLIVSAWSKKRFGRVVRCIETEIEINFEDVPAEPEHVGYVSDS